MHAKRTWTRGGGIAVAVVAALTVAGCGSSGSTSSPSVQSSVPGGSASAPASAPASASGPASASAPASASGSASAAAGSSAAAASSTSGQGGTTAKISLKGADLTVGGKEFTEQLNLCYLTVDVLQAHGASVTQKCGLNGSSTARQALTSGQIDMYWEYTGTAWVNYLHQTKINPDPQKLFDEVAQMDLSKNKIKWLAPAPFSDTYAIIVTKANADRLQVHSLSDYAALIKKDPSKAKTCLASEFQSRPDGWPGLEKAYGFELPSSDIVNIAEGSIFNAVGKGSPCTFGEADSSTDGRIVSLNLVTLTDNKHFFPPYNPALNVRESVFQKYPQLEPLFKQVSSSLTLKAMLQMNTDVDVKGQQAQDVAKAWAKQAGLLG